MPFYDLRCGSCGKEFNIMASMADKAAKNIPCPECGTLDMQTVYNAAPAVVKSLGDRSAPCQPTRACAGCPHAS